MALATCTTRSKEMPRGARGREQRSRELSEALKAMGNLPPPDFSAMVA